MWHVLKAGAQCCGRSKKYEDNRLRPGRERRRKWKGKKKGNGEGKRYANMMTSSMREEKAEREEKQERSHIKHRGRKCTIRIPVQKRGITALKIKNK